MQTSSGVIRATLAAALLAACSMPRPEPASPFGHPPTAASSPGESVGASSAAVESVPAATSVAPEASALSRAVEFHRYALVIVVADGAPLHQGPGPAYPPVEQWTSDPAQALGAPYRLAAGERLIVEGGPLRVDETSGWYLVRPAGLPDPGAPVFTEGWLPSGDPERPFIEAGSEPPVRCCFSAAGAGDAVTAAIPEIAPCSEPNVCGRALSWVAGVGDPGGSCHLRITVSRTGAVLVDDRVDGWTRGAEWWMETDGTTLVVDSDCSWALEVGPA